MRRRRRNWPTSSARPGVRGGLYKDSRAASGELRVIQELNRADGITSIRLVRPTNVRGEFRPDLAVVGTVDGSHVEITTPTLARRGQRGPARARPGGGVREAPPAGRTRPPTRGEIKQAFLRKVRGKQLTAERPGVVAVVVQRSPGGPVLTARDVTDLERAIAKKRWIRELLIVLPGERPLRVGARDSGLGIAKRVLHTP